MEQLLNYYRKQRELDRLLSEKKIIVDKCAKCDGVGIVHKIPKIKKGFDLKKLESKYKRCECLNKFKYMEELIISGIGYEFRNCEKWELFKNRGNKTNGLYVKKYIKDLPVARLKGIGFLFYGKNGTSKTSAGMLILLKALKKKYQVHYVTMRDLLTDIRILTTSDKTYDLEAIKGFLDEISNVDFLFIDEVGKTKISEFVEKEFEGFVRKRITNGLPTILATNLKKQEIIKSYGISLNDLLEGNMKRLEFKGRSYRRKFKTKVVENFFQTEVLK